jgi:hypothetical protein
VVLRGRFGNTDGRPYIEGRLVLPRLNLKSEVTFIVDTGADHSVLMPRDATRMGVDYAQLTGNVAATGIGGLSQACVEDAILAFSEPGTMLYVYRVQILLPAISPDILHIPSLLGRDILNRWSMTYNPSRNRLQFRVVSADFEVRLAK